MSAINYLPPFANSLIMHVLTNAEKLIPLRDAASLAESRRLAGMRMVTGTTSPSTRYERISVSPASCSIKSEYVIASHAFKPQYKCINYTPAWEQRKLGELVVIERGGSPRPIDEYITDDTNGLNWVKIGDAPSLGRYISKTSEKIKPEGLSKTRQVHPGDLILSNSMSFGRPYIMAIEGCIHDGWLLIRDEPKSFDPMYLCHMLGTPKMLNQYRMLASGSTVNNLNKELVSNASILMPCKSEQKVIGQFFNHLDDLITLHQRKRESRIIRVRSFIWLAGDISGIGVSAYQPEREDRMTEGNTNAETLFCDYYEQWISVYKEGAIREVTMKKYRLTQAWLGRLIPDLKLADMDRVNYQKLINGYAEHHERQTTMDFHHQLKGAILDAVDEGLIQRDPTRKAIIKGKPPCSKKTKYLNQFELHAVLADLELGKGPSWDWLILLVAKTGLRFSEALGLTPDDFDFVHQTLSVSKTWDYKNGGGFVPTKNASSVRKVQLDWQLIMQLSTLLKDLPAGDPIFVNGKVYNSTANNILARHCERANVPVISIHGLRHTHASLLLFAGVSIASVSKRLGHASMNTTQDTYLHVIRELENKDVDIVMRALSTLI
ncbi:tyrosine-type recombinase/integrase [Bifidobacterium bifidum]|uniref:Tyrosine-type recombinase/integrase n=4 Tax=Bifidobacterium TaxID=1678 RepID=A0AB36BY37_BIFBI|nr:tyrosine-type recombinase/integrase [Bifidobacterium bifidum]